MPPNEPSKPRGQSLFFVFGGSLRDDPLNKRAKNKKQRLTPFPFPIELTIEVGIANPRSKWLLDPDLAVIESLEGGPPCRADEITREFTDHSADQSSTWSVYT